MGFTINEEIELDNSITLQNIYFTIKGEFQVYKNKLTGLYEIGATSIGYKNLHSYQGGKNPIIHFRITETIQNLNVNFYTIIYNKIKNRAKEIFKNENLTFEDRL